MFWLWCALWATLGHDLLPALHQHAHLRSAVYAAALANPPGEADADDAQRPPPPPPRSAAADSDYCALCVHAAGTCAAMPAPAPFPPAGACRSPSERLPEHAQRPPQRIPWLLAVSRAPPDLSTFL